MASPALELPLIDLSLLSSSPAAVVADIAEACRDPGCFQVINHGVRPEAMQAGLEAAAQFYGWPAAAKAELAFDDIRRPVRFVDGGKGCSLLKLYAHPVRDWIHFWPPDPSFREKLISYTGAVRGAAMTVMGAILHGLGVDGEKMLDELAGDGGLQFVVLNHYPPSPTEEEADALGVRAHSDHGLLTVLHESRGGAMRIVDRRGDGEWRAVAAMRPGALYVQTGDHLEVLSNGRYKAVVHRAVPNAKEERYSIASITSLGVDGKVRCADELVSEGCPARYKETSFREFLDWLASVEPDKPRRYISTLAVE